MTHLPLKPLLLAAGLFAASVQAASPDIQPYLGKWRTDEGDGLAFNIKGDGYAQSAHRKGNCVGRYANRWQTLTREQLVKDLQRFIRELDPEEDDIHTQRRLANEQLQQLRKHAQYTSLFSMCSDGARTHVFISPSHGFYLEEGGGNEWLALMRKVQP